MRSISKLAKSTFLYFTGNVLSKAILFLLMPLYTTYLSTEEFGLYDLENAYISLVLSVVFLEIWTAVLRYIYEHKKTSDKFEVIQSGNGFFLISTVIYVCGMITVGTLVDIPYLGWLLVYGLFQNITTYYGYITRGLGYNTLYAISGLLNATVAIILNIVFITLLHMKVEALYIASIIGYIFCVLFIEAKTHILSNCIRIRPSLSTIKSLLRYAAPLSINSVSFWFLTAYNKTVISSSLGLQDNGLYAVAGRFATAFSLVSSGFMLAWQETAFSNDDTLEQKGILFSKAIEKFSKLAVVSCVCFLSLVWIFYSVFVGDSYLDAKNYIPLYILGTLFSLMGSFTASIYGNLKKTNSILYTTIFGSLVNIALVNALIGTWGIYAANFSLCCGYLSTTILRIVLLGKYIHISIHKKDIFGLVLLLAVPIIAFLNGGRVANMLTLLLGVLMGLVFFRREISTVVRSIKLGSLRRNSM